MENILHQENPGITHFSHSMVGASDDYLNQSGRVLEYQPKVNPKATWIQDFDGLHITAMRAQRIYNNRKWPNPVVIKLTHALPKS